MKVSEMIEKLKECPQDARVAMYVRGNHGALPNVFIEDVIIDNYEETTLGTIVDLVI
jgi:hypothetical protein